MGNSSKSKRRRWILFILLAVFLSGMLLPQKFKMPVIGATKKDFNAKSFWYYPWGKSVTHKGVDVFAKKGTPIHSSTPGVVMWTGNIAMGGNVVLILGPKWRLHYYAHLQECKTHMFSFTNQELIGLVGDSGNAKGKSPHLHYSVVTMVPFPWRMDDSKQGWKKMFYLDPMSYLE